MNSQTRPANRTVPAMLLVFAALTLAPLSAFAQNSEAAYVKQKDSVFLVNQSIYLDEKKVGDIHLFKKLEEATGQYFLNQYIPLASGTAFLINVDGTLITAAHVIQYLPKEKKEESGYWGFLNTCTKNMLPGYLTPMEFRRIVADYKRLLRTSEIAISVESTKGKIYRAAIVNQNESLDLALLKIDFNEQLPPFIVGDSASLQVGDSVVSIGYPLPFIMDEFLDDVKPTVTNGIVSALRTDQWDIQHTAPINPGNSGGPLLSKDGTVIGVIVGTVRGANALHFATSSNKLTNWLSSLGKKELLNNQNGDK